MRIKDSIPPKNLIKREQFFLNKFSKYNQSIVNDIENRCNNIDAFLNQIDSNIECSRAIFASINEKNDITGKNLKIEQNKILDGVYVDLDLCMYIYNFQY